MKNYFYINFVLLLFCFNKFFFGTNNDNEFFPNFTYDNVKDYVKDKEPFNEAKIMLKQYFRVNKLSGGEDIKYTQTTHKNYPCINCFTTINKKTYGIRFYKNSRIEIGLFKKYLFILNLQKGYYWDTENGNWKNIENNTIIEKIKQGSKKIKRVVGNVISAGKKIAKTTTKITKTTIKIGEVLEKEQPKIEEIKKNFNLKEDSIPQMLSKLIDNIYSLSKNEQVVKIFTKQGIEKTVANTNKMNNALDICCCCHFCKPE